MNEEPTTHKKPTASELRAMSYPEFQEFIIKSFKLEEDPEEAKDDDD